MITSRDSDILDALCRKVRLLTPGQAACGWWPEQRTAQETAQRRLRKLAAEGWLNEFKVLSRPLLDLNAPQLAWSPGDPHPALNALAWSCQSRWIEPATMVSVFVASQGTLRRWGARQRPPIKSLGQVTHDLHVTQVYLAYLRQCPVEARRWSGEDSYAHASRHQVLPDALLVNDKEEPVRAIEFGGLYLAKRLIAFHADCVRRHLPYEVW